MTTDRVDTGTERSPLSTKMIADSIRGELELASISKRAPGFTITELTIILNHIESLAAERDTLRTQLDRAKEAMNTAIVKIDDGSPHHARGVLDAALGEMEVEG